MKRRREILKPLLLAALLCAPLSARMAETKAADTFADIADAPAETENRGLVTPQPPRLPHKIIRYGKNDPGAEFQPADKLDTPAELAAELAATRKAYDPFLKDYAPQQPATRIIQTLDSFDWRIATSDDWQNFPAVLTGAGQWTRVKIPHYGEPLGRTNTFYRTTFNLAAWNTNEAVFVRFRGVDYQAHVFMNGAYAGSHEGFFAPFEFDVTRSVHPGENTLFVQVDNDYPTLGALNDTNYPDIMGDKIYGATGPGFNDPDAGWHHDPPGMGIYQPVTIEVRPRLQIHDIFVRPLPETNAAEALIEVWNCDNLTNRVQLEFSVHGLNFKQEVIADRKLSKLDAACPGINFYRVRFALTNFLWWSPDAPWLYDFQVTLRSQKYGTKDNAQRAFGMRSFRMDESSDPKGRLFLNGQEIRLRGANTMGFEQQDVMRGNTGQLRDDLLLAKIAHMNFLRITQRPVQEEVYELADRLGLLIQTDFPLFAHMRPNQFGESLRQVSEMEHLIRPHPSCIMVTYINERFGDKKSRGKMAWRMNRTEQEEWFRAADEVIRQANPDRVVKAVEGDYDPPAPGLPDNHCYTLWYLRNGLDIGRLIKGYWQPVKPGWDYACGEFGAEGLDTVELMRAHCPTNWLPQDADEEKDWTPASIPKSQTAEMYVNFYDKPDSVQGWVDASRSYEAFADRIMTEAFRRDNRMVSFAVHLFIDAWPTGWMKAIVDVDRQPKPAYFAYREALTPLMANIRTDRWKFFSGEKVNAEFWVCNDTHSVPAHPILKWELEMGGKIVHARQLAGTVRPVESVFQGFTAIPVPDVAERTKATLRLALFDGDKLLHDTSTEIEFFPKPAPINLSVQVISSRTNTAASRLAHELHLRISRKATTYLISDYAAYNKRRDEIDAAIMNGATAIFLNLPKGYYWLPDSTEWFRIQAANPIFLSRATGHPLVDGFEPFDFMFWFNESASMITPVANGKFSDDDWDATILKCQDQVSVAERKCGKGRVVLCEALLADRVSANPIARMFAERLLTGQR